MARFVYRFMANLTALIGPLLMAFFSCLVIVFVIIPTVLLRLTLSVAINRIRNNLTKR